MGTYLSTQPYSDIPTEETPEEQVTPTIDMTSRIKDDFIDRPKTYPNICHELYYSKQEDMKARRLKHAQEKLKNKQREELYSQGVRRLLEGVGSDCGSLSEPLYPPPSFSLPESLNSDPDPEPEPESEPDSKAGCIGAGRCLEGRPLPRLTGCSSSLSLPLELSVPEEL